MPTISRRAFLAGTSMAVAGVAAGCTGSASPAEPSEHQKVRVLTGLGFQGREAYLDVAIEKGWFEEVGLEVEVLPGEGTGQNLTLLAEDQAEFATLDISAALIEYSNATHTDFRLVSVLHHDNLSCVMTLEDSDIETIQDLEGKKVAAIPGGINTVAFPLLAELAQFDASKVELIPLTPPNPPTFGAALKSGQVDAIMQFIVGQGAIAGIIGEPVRVHPYSDWIIDMYGSGFGVKTALAADNPDLVRRFNTAAFRALAWTVGNPVEAAEIFAARHEEQPAEAAAGEIQLLKSYVRPAFESDGQLHLGEIGLVRLAQNIALLEGLGEIEAGIEPDDVAVFGLVGEQQP